MKYRISAKISVPLNDKSKIISYYHKVKLILKKHLEVLHKNRMINLQYTTKFVEYPDVIVDHTAAGIEVEIPGNFIIKVQNYCKQHKLIFENVEA